ncbi:hypothetical protein AVEN_64693-1 [Araneus ventricosus]|uniref:Uncharacterized protein n=1 Tax=Araneus ventricosus TaxID=182803 RepID=A0A4Y2Q612_ARAVE|nr:hypothetical protein AVEN_64693-1 [Araneus ventricosus]
MCQEFALLFMEDEASNHPVPQDRVPGVYGGKLTEPFTQPRSPDVPTPHDPRSVVPYAAPSKSKCAQLVLTTKGHSERIHQVHRHPRSAKGPGWFPTVA